MNYGILGVPVLGHDASNARVSSQPVQQLGSFCRGRLKLHPLPGFEALEGVLPCA